MFKNKRDLKIKRNRKFLWLLSCKIEEVDMFEKAYKKGKEEMQLEIVKNFIGILNEELIASKFGISIEKVINLKESMKKIETSSLRVNLGLFLLIK